MTLMATEKPPALTVTNWFERKAEYIATWNPGHAIQGWASGSRANGLIIDEALNMRALEIQDGWRSSL